MAGFGDGGPEDNSFDMDGGFVCYVLDEFGGCSGGTGVMFAAMAVTWMIVAFSGFAFGRSPATRPLPPA